MKKARVLRIAAFALALIFMMSTCVVVASAAKKDNGSVSETTTDDIKELLGTISYNKYVENKNELTRTLGAISGIIILIVCIAYVCASSYNPFLYSRF